MSRLYKWAAIPVLAVAIAVAGYFWLVASDDSAVNAQIAVEGACQEIQQVTSFDATHHYTFDTTENRSDAPNRIVRTTKYEFNGEDSQSVAYDENGVVRAETKVVDGVSYMKDKAFGDYWSVLDWSLANPFPLLADQELCVNFTDFADLGEDRTIDGLLADHYSAGSALIGPMGRVSEETIQPGGFAQTEELYKFWVDGDGQLLQMKKNRTYVGVTSEGVKEITKVESLTQFSGFGEPNLITAPATTTQ